MFGQTTIVLDIHRVCNQRCAYCVAHAESRDFGRITEDATQDDLNWLYSNFSGANIIFTGGEPLITPNIEAIFQGVIDAGHSVSLQSNFRVRARAVLSRFAPERFGWILSTFHSVEIPRFPRYLETVASLRREGYPIVVKLVLDEPMLEHFEAFHDALLRHDTPVILAPLVFFPSDAPPYPKPYTREQWERIAPRLSLKSSWLYFAGGFKSRNVPCHAGERLLYTTFYDGNIRGCSHGFPPSVGNLYRRELTLRPGPVPCGLDCCFCDFHYYCGVTPSPDDSADFARLLKDPGRLTTFAEYARWLRDERITPAQDLAPLCGDAPAAGTAGAHRPSPAPARQPEPEPGRPCPVVPVEKLHEALGLAAPLDYPAASLEKDLKDWRMEIDDAPIFRYLYRNLRPRRHLEFGTWQGAGTVYCLEECDATVWTINMPAGELLADGQPGYMSAESYGLETMPAAEWARRIGLSPDHARRTDTFGFIGRFYLEKGLGHRVCQIYCDSTRWDDSQYPDSFFDSALIDGGHTPEVVASDTEKALRLVRSGGLILWHDFCPPVTGIHAAPRGVGQAIERLAPRLDQVMRSSFWIRPSWILLGIKR